MATPNLQAAQGTLSRDEAQNKRRLVVADGAQTLTTAQSGALCLFNNATGFTYTLPAITANTVGTWFEFECAVTNTGTVAKVITDAATTFLLGAVWLGVSDTTPAAGPGPKSYACNGTTHRAINQGGSDTTTGGVIGSCFKVTAISATQWVIEGFLLGAGTIASPVATS